VRFFWIPLFLIGWSLFAESIINLRSSSVYVRPGFDISWSKPPQTLSRDWLRVTPGFGTTHSLSARYISIPTLYARKFLSLQDPPDETLSYLFHFSLEEDQIANRKVSGIFLTSIGIRWQAYLNGDLIDDKLEGNNTRYNYIIPVPHSYLVPGENYLLFRIEGPRSNHLVGFYKSREYLFGDLDTLTKKSTDFFSFSIILIYFLIGIFHFILFLRKPSEYYNGFYALFSFTLSIYIMSSSRFIFFFLEDSVVAYKIQSIVFFSLPLIGICFLRTLFGQKFKIPEIVLIPLSICLVLGTAFFSSSWIIDIISIYKYLLPGIGIYVLTDIVGVEFLRDLREILSQETKMSLNKNAWSVFSKALFSHISGNLFLGILFFDIAMFIDVLDMILIHSGVFLSRYGLALFVLSTAFSLSNRYIKISRKNQELYEELKTKLRELEASDQKNRFLIDGTRELLFVLGPEYEIRSMNQAARKYFGVKPESLLGKSFLDLLYTTPKDEHIIHQIVKENIQKLNAQGRQTSFRARIRTTRMQEPLEFLFRMEAVDAVDHLEFIGKATSAFDENLTQFVVREVQIYRISNYIWMAEELSHRLVRLLNKKIPEFRVDAIRTGLLEILVNSIEHGNLNISFEEKSQHLSKGDYLQLIAARQKDPVYSRRMVEVHYELNDQYVSYQITDEGNGFDYQALIQKTLANQKLGREHGRGILLAENIFDIVEYKGKGNSVYLQVNFETSFNSEALSNTDL